MHGAHLARGEMVQAELNAELVLRGGAAEVNLVAKDEEGHIVQLLAAEQLLRAKDGMAQSRQEGLHRGHCVRQLLLARTANVGPAHIELVLRLGKALAVMSVDEEDDCVHLREVVLPHAASNLVPTQVKRAELDLGNGELLRGWVREAARAAVS